MNFDSKKTGLLVLPSNSLPLNKENVKYMAPQFFRYKGAWSPVTFLRHSIPPGCTIRIIQEDYCFVVDGVCQVRLFGCIADNRKSHHDSNALEKKKEVAIFSSEGNSKSLNELLVSIFNIRSKKKGIYLRRDKSLIFDVLSEMKTSE